MTATLPDLLRRNPVMPVVTIGDVSRAVPLARALLAGGVSAIEVTLRTAAALESIRRIAAEVPEMILGAGTVLAPEQGVAASAAGAGFLVSPGLTATLAEAADAMGAPLLPGVATASEAMQAREWGFAFLKLFPAEAAGGKALLRSLAGPLPDLRFCPTGGIDAIAAPSYLAIESVVCVGGSWIATDAAIAAGDWVHITERARGASALRPAPG